ncbi:hypothetical protein [Pseudomonas sp. RT6P73]
MHSNIGGGYRAEAQGCVLVGPMQGLTVAQGTDVKTTSIYRDALVHKAQLVAQGWPEAMLEVVTPPPKVVERVKDNFMEPAQKRVYAGLQLKRPVRGCQHRLKTDPPYRSKTDPPRRCLRSVYFCGEAVSLGTT